MMIQMNRTVEDGSQISLFDMETSVPGFAMEAPVSGCKWYTFPESAIVHTPPRKGNYRKGEEQTVYPIKKREELEAVAKWLYENADHKYLLGFILGINLGLRANELLKLKTTDLFNEDGSIRYVEDVEDTSDRISIYQSKTDKARGFYLNKACVKALQWYYPYGCRIEDYIFASREGGHIKPDTFRKILKAAAKACGLKQNIGTHTMRKTWGWWQHTTNPSRACGDISQLQRLFGHDSPMTTLRYIGITDEEDKALYHSMVLDVFYFSGTKE